MKQLWSPWRRAYVSDSSRGAARCFLCDAATATAADRSAGIVHVAEHSIIMLNRYPYSVGHLLVSPRGHVADVLDLDDDGYICLMNAVRAAVRAVRQAFDPHGINVGVNLGSAAGAGVPGHVHIHVVPRWNGDTNFMPVIGQTQIISTSMDEAWDRIATVLDTEGNQTP